MQLFFAVYTNYGSMFLIMSMAIVFFMSALSLLIRLMFMPLILDYYVVQPSPRIVGLSKDSANKTNKERSNITILYVRSCFVQKRNLSFIVEGSCYHYRTIRCYYQ